MIQFFSASITETVCAMAIMQLVEIVLLDCDTDINKYITENNRMPMRIAILILV